MSNFTVRAVKDSNSTKGTLNHFYTCRTFTAYEDGEILLEGVYGSIDDIPIWVNGNNYEKVYIMNPNGKTIYTCEA